MKARKGCAHRLRLVGAMPELTDLTLNEITQGLRQAEFSSLELTRLYLERIAALEPSLHAFITLTPEAALQQAAEADRGLFEWRKRSGLAASRSAGGAPGGERCALRGRRALYLRFAHPGKFHPSL